MADGESLTVGGGGSLAVPLSLVAASGCATLLLASGLAYAMSRSGRGKASSYAPPEAAALEEEKDDTAESVEDVDMAKYPGGYVTVYYGSQTGTAESFSQELAREGDARGVKIRVADLEETEGDTPGALRDERYRDEGGRSRAVFLMATYGEGEPTDNAAGFVGALKSKAGIGSNYAAEASSDEDAAEEKKGEGCDDDDGDGGDRRRRSNLGGGADPAGVDPRWLEGLEYCVFGLGNRQYEHFCSMGKLTDRALGMIGGRRIAELGIGDDDDDLEADFERWKDDVLWPAIVGRYVGDRGDAAAADGGEGTEAESLPECPYVVEYLPKDDERAEPDMVTPEDVHTSTKHYFTAVDCPVTAVRELRTSDDPGSTVHVEIDISDSGMKYHTADNLGVLPVNDPSIVEAVARALSLDLDAKFRLRPNLADGKEHRHAALFPTPCAVRECLGRYCDLTSAPRRSELKQLAQYATDPLDRSALLRMSSREGKAEYREKILGMHVGVADIVSKLCPSIRMPLEHFINVCPRLQPRYYTISSSSSVHPTSVHITVSVLTEEKGDGTVHRGVCSSYLSGMQKGGTVRVFCRDSSFRLPSDPERPVIMIGPGTGVAPMRALLQERSHQRKSRNLPVGPNVLYFGCKRPDQDYIYEDEMARFREEGTLTDLRVAFSRTTHQKVYVQHLLARNAEETYRMMDSMGASVYVCGGTRMGHDVSETLRGIVSDVGNVSRDDARAYLDGMAGEGRYVQELWS